MAAALTYANVAEFLKWTATGAGIALLTSYCAPHVRSRFSTKAKPAQKGGPGEEDEVILRSGLSYSPSRTDSCFKQPKATEPSEESLYSFPKNLKNLVFLDSLEKVQVSYSNLQKLSLKQKSTRVRSQRKPLRTDHGEGYRF